MSEGLIFEILERSKKNKEIICLWLYKDEDNEFWSGYVKDYNDELVTIKHFTEYGKPDGVVIERTENIMRVSFDVDYAEAMQCLIDYGAELDKEDNVDIELTLEEDWQVEVLKQLEGLSNHIVRLEINEKEYSCGFVKRVSEVDVLIHSVGKMGEDEGQVVYLLEDITALRINDIENRKRNLLFNWRKASFDGRIEK
ncbi:hypothetical protein [Mangrovimonas aestuarii]|uniref:hypothetical protein n=1 Tax=Mangrovimonas aestuarii TaxID=3018443 RepID=UPI0023790CE0|nr:hypothetical protein [Mangrovimonas aestuarii]